MKYIKQSVLCFARLKTPIKIRNGKDIKIILLLAYKKMMIEKNLENYLKKYLI